MDCYDSVAHLCGLERRYRLGEVRMISVDTIVRGEEAVIPGEPAAAANANTLR